MGRDLPVDEQTVAEVGEFGLIRRVTDGRRQPASTLLGPGDDAAVVAVSAGPSGGVSVAFGVAQVPETWIVDPFGIVRARFAGEVTADKVSTLLQQLREGKTATHARLGVSVQDAGSDDGLLSGASVQVVNNGSAADKAGLQKGDVITKVDDTIITGSDSLVATVRGHRPGDSVTLTVADNSGAKTRTVDVELNSDEGSATR